MLGSYLRHFADGDPARAPALDLGEASRTDTQAGKLQRLLTHYAAALDDTERQLMALLSVFTSGVEVELCSILASDIGIFAGHVLYFNEDDLNLAEIAWAFLSQFTLHSTERDLIVDAVRFSFSQVEKRANVEPVHDA